MAKTQGEKAIAEVTKLADQLQLIYDELAVNSVPEVLKIIRGFRKDVALLYDRNLAICQALEVDNWYNATQKAASLVAKASLKN